MTQQPPDQQRPGDHPPGCADGSRIPRDELAYVIEDGRAVPMRFDTKPRQNNPFAAFTEWNSEADARAYEKLRRLGR